MKSRTIIGELGRPPCLECFRTGHDCNLAGSRRGGDYTHLRKPRRGTRRAADASSHFVLPVTKNPHHANKSVDCSQDKEPICSELKNPLDALLILAEAAVNDPEPSIDSVLTPESAEGEYDLGPTIALRFLIALKLSPMDPARIEFLRQVLKTTN